MNTSSNSSGYTCESSCAWAGTLMSPSRWATWPRYSYAAHVVLRVVLPEGHSPELPGLGSRRCPPEQKTVSISRSVRCLCRCPGPRNCVIVTQAPPAVRRRRRRRARGTPAHFTISVRGRARDLDIARPRWPPRPCARARVRRRLPPRTCPRFGEQSAPDSGGEHGEAEAGRGCAKLSVATSSW